MENPCYNSQTKESCPERCQGCAVTCKAWAVYLVKRDRENALRHKKKHEQRDVNAVNIHGIMAYKRESCKYRKR